MKYFNGKRDFVFVKDFDVFCNKYAFNPKKQALPNHRRSINMYSKSIHL